MTPNEREALAQAVSEAFARLSDEEITSMLKAENEDARHALVAMDFRAVPDLPDGKPWEWACPDAP